MFQLQRNTEQVLIRNGHDNYVVSNPNHRINLHFPRPTFIPIWNSLPDDIKATGSHKVFKRQCKDKFLESYPTSVDCDIPHCEYCVD